MPRATGSPAAPSRPNASSTHLDSREAIAQTQAARALSHSLADLAHKQNAGLKGDPQADRLPAIDSLKQAETALSATARHAANTSAGQGQGSDDGIKATLGGTGTVPAWSQPQLHLSAPAGIALLTPEHHILAAGKHLAIATGHDTNFVAQGNHSLAVKEGLAIFTAGQATDKQKPNQETGIHLHAASGAVSLQSQSGKTTAAADKKVTFASTTGKLTAGAKQKILATAQGAYLKIEGGNIELHAPKKVEFKASKKDWTGPKSASIAGADFPQSSLNLKKGNLEITLVDANGVSPASENLSLNIRGEQHDTSAAGGTATIKDVLPGLLFGKQGNRKS